MGKKAQVSNQARRRHPLRMTNQMTFPTLQMVLKAGPSLCVASAAVAFPSHFGIAYFAKVGPEDNSFYLHVLNILASLLLLDDLYICGACDADGVPDLTRSSGKHTEEHHLIRCLAPAQTDDKASPTDERLTSIEGRLDALQTQFNDLTGRIGNMEQLLHRLVGASEGRTA